MFPVYFVTPLFPWGIRFQAAQSSQAVDFFSGSFLLAVPILAVSFYLHIEFPAHPSDVALICKAVVGVVSNDNVFMNGDAHHFT